MKKRILSIVLAICLVLSCMPTTVFAANSDATELQNKLNSGGTVTLSKDYTIDTTLNVKNTVTLNLNGHVIKMTGSGSVIKVGTGGYLTMTDSNKTATHTDTSLPAGGVITGGNAKDGGGVRVGESFTMNGGTIANCSAEYGGGVCVAYGTFTMNGGAIKNCTSTINDSLFGGGGVFVYSTSGGNYFNMNGGIIENCSAQYGGGVYSKSHFSLSGNAIIRGCSAKFTGGIILRDGDTFTMTGGTIETCTSTDKTSDAVRIVRAYLLANGGSVKGTVSTLSNSGINTTSTDSCTKFYNEVTNYGTISGGVYYGGIQNKSSGTVSGTYHTVSFDSNGGSGSVPTQWFVNTDKATALQPANPTKDGFVFAGWYNGDTKYDFTQPVTSNITLTAKWVTTNVSTEAELKEALNAGATSIKLVSDFNLSSTLDLTDKNITLDLNGYVLTGDIQLADSSAAPQSILTLIDSRPTATHTDSSMPVGGVVNGDITLTRGNGSVSHLYANGGTVTGMASLPSYAGGIFCTSDTPTVFKGYVGNYGEIHGGIFYGTIKESCIKEKTVTFMNSSSRHALQVVADGNIVVEPTSPSVKTGYRTFEGWYNGDTKYTFGSTISQSITLNAKYSNPITYNISYNLDGGTATNPATYNVESDAITLNNPTKTGYTFTGWSGTGLTGENNMTVTIAKGSTGNRTYTAHFSQNNYTVKFDTNGGSSISDNTSVKWTDKVLDGITPPTKDGWEFTGWKYGNVTVNANTKYSYLAANDTVASVTLVAQWRDIAGPTGEISVGTNKWNSFINTITFGLFFKDTQTVTITASDNSGDALKIEYLLSDKALSETELVSATFTSYTKAFSINPDNKYVIYAKLTDKVGNVSYLSSDGIVLDATAPVITGIENGKTYCSSQTVTVSDNEAIDMLTGVTVNGTVVTLDANNQFTLNPAEGTQTIVVTDKAGNVSAEMIVTVNNGHTYEWQSDNSQYWQKCSICSYETAKKDIPTITINGADKVCLTQDYVFSFTLPEGVTNAVYGYDFGLKGEGFPAVVENNEAQGVIYATWYLSIVDSFVVYAGGMTADGFRFSVRKTVLLQKEHTGGEATCIAKAICEVCGEEYGEINSSNHTHTEIRNAIQATCTETGYSGDKYCTDCETLLEKGKITDIAPHNFQTTVIEPTENKQGYTKHTCKDCRYSYIDNITEFASDNSALIAALETIESCLEEDYSAQSFANLQSIYNQYSSMATGSYTQLEIDNAVFDLLTAISELEPYLNLNTSASYGTFTVTYNNETNSNFNHSLLFGTNVTLTATAKEGYEFVGWYDTINNLYFSKNAEYSFKLTTNTSLKAVFVKEQSATLTFATYSNWVQSTVTKTIAQWNSVSSIDDLLPTVPYKYGYSNGRWVYNNAEVLAKLQTGENVTLIPEYDEDDTSLPTPPSPKGYTPALDLYYKLDAGANVGSFVMAAGIPENCKIESVGILFYYKNANEFNPTSFELLTNNKMLAGRFNTDEKEDIYIVNMNKMTSKYNWAARGYVSYYDANGNLKTVYSNQVNIVNREQV